ncbi:RipA family octameric membrane protein [Microbulbifer spongiae]|uniref:DUF4231 domain-containing protein n=1 Tax=Microbulbifer spongiae TaxID=2944933 RepID=A0ABY9E8E3_9GAMM|nr:hypothetical protein [Microbulbifer sp. MI-G]WKD48211.1 hypothetical protein M8T91_09690 [Microbulbifer sp. MI-G]
MSKIKNTTTEEITSFQYKRHFQGKEEKALERAYDIRKFEIDLYWKRAAYFWAFIGATFAGFLAIQASGAQNKQDLSVILSCLGVVFSFAWLCVNKGSKFWQENWEKHVDILEDKVTGPLYKVVMHRNVENYDGLERVQEWMTGPSALSASKINQLISLYMFILWVMLLFYSSEAFRFSQNLNFHYCILIGLTTVFCGFFMLKLGRTYRGGYWHIAELRRSRIKPTIENDIKKQG